MRTFGPLAWVWLPYYRYWKRSRQLVSFENEKLYTENGAHDTNAITGETIFTVHIPWYLVGNICLIPGAWYWCIPGSYLPGKNNLFSLDSSIYHRRNYFHSTYIPRCLVKHVSYLACNYQDTWYLICICRPLNEKQ